MAQRESVHDIRQLPIGALRLGSSVGWAESPLQLLALVEGHAAGVLGPTSIVIPRMDASWLEATARELSTMDLPAGLLITAPRMSIPIRSNDLAVGDFFSGVVQRSLVLRRRDRLVIVDDGLATVELLRLIAQRRSLIRARVRNRLPKGAARWALGQATLNVLRRAAQRGQLEVFTAMKISTDLRDQLNDLGVTIRQHNFPWLRSQPITSQVPPRPTIVLGSSLSHDGLVKPDRYLSWLLDRADQGPLAYYPHRREDARILTRFQSHPNVLVERTGLPVELSLRGLNREQRIVSLPSTAVVSLRLMLVGSGASVDVVDVPSDWWTGRASLRLRQSLRRMVTA